MGDAERFYASLQGAFAGNDEYNQLDFVVRSIMAGMATATLVRVEAVDAGEGVAPVGFVDVQPMVAQVDGAGQPTPHGIVHGVPFFRLQGGSNAVIIDPVPGDIGVCVFASHDISSVKANRAPANPGSRRRFAYSDGLYLGGFLNGAPQNYVRFTTTGDIELKPATKVTVIGSLEATVDVKANGVSLATHQHSGVSTGTGESGPPIPSD